MTKLPIQHKADATTSIIPSRGTWEGKCDCGGSLGFSGECPDCRTNKLLDKPLQTKLRISEPDDQYEQEADRVAERVMRMTIPAKKNRNSIGAILPLIQRKINGGGVEIGPASVAVQGVFSSPGQPLDVVTRAFFEPRFGHDFGNVRVHSDVVSAQSAHEINAKAFTVGPNIIFGAGQFSTKTHEGKRLLAHELTHVIQQRRANFSGLIIQRAKIPYGSLTWADFKAQPPANRNPAEGAGILSAFDIPGIAVSPDTKKTRKKCRIGNRNANIYEATLSIDRKAFDSLASYMDQERSWALNRYKNDGTAYCENRVGKSNAKQFSQCLADERVERARLLHHEQVHFDITNVMAGNARVSLSTEAAKIKLTATGCGQEAASDEVLAAYDKPHDDLIDLGKKWQTSKDQAQDDFDIQTGHGAKITEQTAWEGRIQAGLKDYDPNRQAPAATPPVAPAQTPSKPAARPANGYSYAMTHYSQRKLRDGGYQEK